MQHCQLDHLTITAPTLASGAAFVAEALGVELQTGGEHPRMGTHNLLLRLGDALFLEVIAVNPQAAAPGRPRWFGLDDNPPAGRTPRLATWVARTGDIHRTAAAVPEALGPVETMTRGALQWWITIPADGGLPLDGVAPALIQWQTPTHPATSLRDAGCTLLRLELFHAEAGRARAVLSALGMPETPGGPDSEHGLLVVPLPPRHPPYLVAHILTPQGPRTLGGPPNPL